MAAEKPDAPSWPALVALTSATVYLAALLAAERQAVIIALAVAGVFHNNHFVLLLMVTVLLYSVATLGLNVQFGYAGVVNFAGASFFGIGAYTSAVLNAQANIPPLVVIVIGGLLAALVRFCCSRSCAPAATTRRW
jgi:ABC-type branched-subunit amino acid transport system permease subunit